MSKNNIFDTVQLAQAYRSNVFDLSRENLLTGDIGKLYPVLSEFLIPGDKVSVTVNSVIKALPTLSPAFGRINVDFHAFVVPLRLLWDHFPKWCYKIEDTEHYPPSVPVSSLLENSDEKNLLGYLGVPFRKPSTKPDHTHNRRANLFLPLAYHLIWNEYFRNEQLDVDLTEPGELLGDISLEDYTALTVGSGDDYWKTLHYRNWRRDYFTSALPNAISGVVPTLQLYGAGAEVPVEIRLSDFLRGGVPQSEYPGLMTTDLTEVSPNVGSPNLNVQNWKSFLSLGFNPATETISENFRATILQYTEANQAAQPQPNSPIEEGHWLTTYGRNVADETIESENNVSARLVGKLGSVASDVTVDSLRSLFAIQKFLEIRNVSGSRYIEGTLNYYGVRVKDSRAQRPEYLGMTSSVVQMNEVIQNSESDKSVQGTRTGLQNSFVVSRPFKYFNTEHSVLMILMSIRPDAFYYQGLRRHWLIMEQLDFPYRLFQHLGEQEVYQYELMPEEYVHDGSFEDVFGYQSRYAEWRSAFNEVHGALQSSLDFWHIGRKFSFDDFPALSDQFVRISNDSGDFNRIFPVTEEGEESTDDHYICDVFFGFRCRRGLAYHSRPTLIG